MGKVFDARVFLESLFATPDTIAPVPLTTPGIRIEDLDPEWRIEWEERAAIMEYDGGMMREHAEAAALRDICQRMKQADFNIDSPEKSPVMGGNEAAFHGRDRKKGL